MMLPVEALLHLLHARCKRLQASSSILIMILKISDLLDIFYQMIIPKLGLWRHGGELSSYQASTFVPNSGVENTWDRSYFHKGVVAGWEECDTNAMAKYSSGIREQQSIDDHWIRKRHERRPVNYTPKWEKKNSINVYKVSNSKAKTHSSEKNAFQTSKLNFKFQDTSVAQGPHLEAKTRQLCPKPWYPAPRSRLEWPGSSCALRLACFLGNVASQEKPPLSCRRLGSESAGEAWRLDTMTS